MTEVTSIHLKIRFKECGTIFEIALPSKEVWEHMKNCSDPKLFLCNNCYVRNKNISSCLAELIYRTISFSGNRFNFEPPKENKGV